MRNCGNVARRDRVVGKADTPDSLGHMMRMEFAAKLMLTSTELAVEDSTTITPPWRYHPRLLQNISKTGEDSWGLLGTHGGNKLRLTRCLVVI